MHKYSIFNGKLVPAVLKLWNLVQIYTSMRKSEWYYGNLNMMFYFMVMFSLKTVTYHLVCMFVISFRSKFGGYMTQKWKYFTFHFVRIWARIPIFLIMFPNSESIALGPYKISISCFVQIKVETLFLKERALQQQIRIFAFIDAIVSILTKFSLDCGVFSTQQFQKNNFMCMYPGKLFRKMRLETWNENFHLYRI